MGKVASTDSLVKLLSGLDPELIKQACIKVAKEGEEEWDGAIREVGYQATVSALEKL